MPRKTSEMVLLDSKQACAACIAESYLASFFPSHDGSGGLACAYCGLRSFTLGVGWLANQCERVFEAFYESTGGDDKVVLFERSPDGSELSDCVYELLPGANTGLIEDVSQLLILRLDEEDGSDPDPYYIRRNKLGDFYSVDWRQMSDSLRNEARLCNPLVSTTLDRFLGQIAQDSTNDGKKVIVCAGPDSGIKALYRARVFQSLDVLEEAMRHPEAQLGPLPKGMGRAGRMNASGVSVFYGGTSAEVARAEVRPPVGSLVLLGQFSLARPMRLLDLDALSRLKADPSLSLFDPEALFIHGRCDFLAKLVVRLTMPVMPQDEENSYLITQAIADYLATHPGLELDGIIFRSAQVSKTEDGEVGRNVVLFHKSSRVDKAERIYQSGRASQVIEESEDGSRWDPYIWWGDQPQHLLGSGLWETEQRPVSLVIVQDSLEIHQIEEVKFKAKVHSVISVSSGVVNTGSRC